MESNPGKINKLSLPKKFSALALECFTTISVNSFSPGPPKIKTLAFSRSIKRSANNPKFFGFQVLEEPKNAPG